MRDECMSNGRPERRIRNRGERKRRTGKGEERGGKEDREERYLDKERGIRRDYNSNEEERT